MDKEIISKFKEGQRMFGEDIATIINTVLLSFVYVVGVGVTSIFAMIFNKKFLDEKIEKEKLSYWIDYNLTIKNKEEYYRQF